MQEHSKISFFNALIGTCSGLNIFFQLRFQSIIRTIFHLLLLSLLLAVFVSWGEYGEIEPKIDVFSECFGENFEGIKMSETGIFPMKDIEVAKSFSPFYDMKFIYLPSEKDILSPDVIGSETSKLIIWRPQLLIFAMKVPDNLWQTMIVNGSENKNTQMTLNEICNYKSSKDFKMNTPFGANLNITNAELFDSVKSMFVIMIYLINVFVLFSNAIIFTALFTMSFSLFGMRKLTALPAKNLWITGVYASFPCMIVASCFPALNIEYFSYSTIFMIGLVVYWMMVIKNIEKNDLIDKESDDDRTM